MPILFSRARSPTSPRPGPRQVRSGDQPQDRKAPDLGVPPLLQQRADEVIERAHCHLCPSLLMQARAGQLFGYEQATRAPSSLADWEPKRLRASGRDGGLSHDNAIPVSSHNAPFPSYKRHESYRCWGTRRLRSHRPARRQAVFFVPSLTPAV
jgi:hypothetical protein